MRRLVTVLFLIIFSSHCVSAQVLSEKRFEVLFGFQGISRDSLPDATNIDFLNYIDAQGFSGNYSYLGFVGSARVGERMFCSFLVGMYSDLSPVNYNFSATYFPFSILGFGASFFGYPQYINSYNQYHWNTDIGMFADLDNNYLQRRLYNLGMAIGPEVKYKYNWLDIKLKVHAGVRWTRSLKDHILQKQIRGNYMRMISYQTASSPNLYLFPELELGFKLFRISETNIGFRTRMAGEISRRTINYTITTAEWTTENAETRSVDPPAHHYSKIDIDFGIYFDW